MKHLTTVLILILASTNASKFFEPNNQFQQDPDTKEKYQDIIIDSAFDDDRFSPQASSMNEGTRWESRPNQKVLVISDLKDLENLLQEDPNDWRMKRTGSLSIVDPLDVLRDQYARTMTRKIKFKSFENRDQLGSAGKRSRKGNQFQVRYSKQPEFPRKMTQKGFFENGIDESDTHLARASNERNPTTRRYQTRVNRLSYQT